MIFVIVKLIFRKTFISYLTALSLFFIQLHATISLNNREFGTPVKTLQSTKNLTRKLSCEITMMLVNFLVATTGILWDKHVNNIIVHELPFPLSPGRQFSRVNSSQQRLFQSTHQIDYQFINVSKSLNFPLCSFKMFLCVIL